MTWIGWALLCSGVRGGHGVAGQSGRGSRGLQSCHRCSHHGGRDLRVEHRHCSGQAWRDPQSGPANDFVSDPSGLATGLSWLCYFRALQLGPASRVAPLDKLSVPLVMVFAWLILGEKFNWMALVGGLLITAGAMVMVLA